jgi:LysM repeat protein
LDDQSVRLQADEELSKLRRENDELRAELAVLRGGGAVPVNRTARMINVPLETRSAPPIIAATPANAQPEAPLVPAPAPLRGGMAGTAGGVGPGVASAPAPARGGSSVTRTAIPPTRPSTATRGTHTVAPKETLFSLSKRYGVRMEDLAAANGITVNTPLKIGTVLKIPVASGR